MEPSFFNLYHSRGIVGFDAARGRLSSDGRLPDHYFLARNLVEDDVLAGIRNGHSLDIFRSSDEALLGTLPENVATVFDPENIE